MQCKGNALCERAPVGEWRDHEAHGVAQVLECIFHDGGDDFTLHAAGIACVSRSERVHVYVYCSYVCWCRAQTCVDSDMHTNMQMHEIQTDCHARIPVVADGPPGAQ